MSSFGFGAPTTQIPVTPYRGTRIRFDVNEPVLLEPWFSVDRKFAQIGQVPPEKQINVHFVEGIGWTLKPKGWEVVETHETDLDANVYQPSPPAGGLLAVVATNFEKRKGFRSPIALPGATDGASGDLASETDTFITNAVPAGTDFGSDLDADYTAFPPPDAANDHIVLDRVLISDTDMLPTYSVQFRVYVPGSGFKTPQRIANLYFTGVAGSDETLEQGFGQYCLSLYGTGLAVLYEKGNTTVGADDNVWKRRKTFRYADPNRVTNTTHLITVVSDAIDAREQKSIWMGRRITITTENGDHNFVNKLVGLAIYAIAPNTTVYNIPRLRSYAIVPTVPTKVRLDLRRDMRAWFQVSRHVYPLTGTLVDGPFAVPCPPSTRTHLQAEWYGALPSSVDVAITLKYADGAQESLTEILSQDITSADGISLGGFAQFHPYVDDEDYGRRYFFAEYEITGDGTSTPIIRQTKYLRDAVIEVVDDAEEFGTDVNTSRGTLPPYALTSVSVSGSEGDITHESASATLYDLTNAMSTLKTRAGMRVHIDTQWNSADATDRCILFAGYLNRATSKRIKVKAGVSYPHSDSRSYELQLVGMFQRLNEQLTPRFDWSVDPNDPLDANGNPQPFKVTEIIESLLNAAGFPDEMIDIADNPIRLWPSNGGDDNQYVMEPLTNIAEAITKFARDYLGGWLIFDANAGDYGKWKFLPGKRAPYTNVAAFISTGVSSGKASFHLPSYATSPPTAPIRSGTYSSWVRKPEGNMVIVSSDGDLTSSGVRRAGAVKLNNRSFNFYGWPDGHANAPDPTDPDYLGRVVPIFVLEPLADASDEQSVSRILNWVANRVYEISCLGAKMVSFEAPLLLIEHEDDSSRRRPLRFYDPVTVDGVQFLVRNVNPSYRKDHVQMAIYELEAPRF